MLGFGECVRLAHYQLDSRVLYTLVTNKSFGQLLNISPKNSLFLKSFNHSFHVLKYALPIKILKQNRHKNITLVIN